MAAGTKRHAITTCSISKTSGKLPHRCCIRQDVANIPHPASDFTIVVKKADDAALRVSREFTCQTTERCCMPFRSKTIRQNNGVIPPHHPFRANQYGELPEHLKNFALFRNTRLKRCIIRRKCKQEIIRISQHINFGKRERNFSGFFVQKTKASTVSGVSKIRLTCFDCMGLRTSTSPALRRFTSHSS